MNNKDKNQITAENYKSFLRNLDDEIVITLEGFGEEE